jgi:hypothetical protein
VSTPSRTYGQPAEIEALLNLARVDFPSDRRLPSAVRMMIATILSLAGSIAADALLVAVGKIIFPTTKYYVHFRPSDYGKLTIIGVIVACAAWPVVTWVSSAPRWLFFRLAILVTMVLLLPDLYLLYMHQPGKAVLVLMSMHLAIALVTYNALVRVAPQRRDESSDDG